MERAGVDGCLCFRVNAVTVFIINRSWSFTRKLIWLNEEQMQIKCLHTGDKISADR